MKVTRILSKNVGEQNTIRIDLYERDAAILLCLLRIVTTVQGLFSTERSFAMKLRQELAIVVEE